MIEAIKHYFEQCPLLKRGKVNVNYLGDEPVKYTIDNIPANPIVKRYIDGGTLCQYIFVFAIRESYGKEAEENVKIAQFFEELSDWVEQQDNAKSYPQFTNSKIRPTKIEVLTSGYLYDADVKTQRSQIQLKLTYRKDM